MKNVIRLLILTAIVATVALPSFAQATQPSTTAAAGGQVDEKAKADLYERWRSNRRENQQVAYEAGKEYLQKYGSDKDEYVAAVRKFVDSYEKATLKFEFENAFNSKNFPRVFELGRKILASEPEDVRTHVILAYAGLLNTTSGGASSEAFNADAANYARRSVQLLQSGKTAENWAPFAGKDDAAGWLHYALGVLTLKSSPQEAVNHFAQAAQSQSSAKKDPTTYFYLATAYQVGPYLRLSEEYKRRFQNQPETDESKAALEQLNLLVDRIIDAYARAVSFSANNPAIQARKNEWMKALTEFYKFRHNDSDAKLQEFIAGVQATPLPAPVNPTFAPAAPATPATGTTPPAGTTPSTGTPGTTSSSGTDSNGRPKP